MGTGSQWHKFDKSCTHCGVSQAVENQVHGTDGRQGTVRLVCNLPQKESAPELRGSHLHVLIPRVAINVCTNCALLA